MDKDKNTRTLQNQGQKTKREPAEDVSRGQSTGNRAHTGGLERGSGSQDERTSSGISNRGMGRSEEQADLPSRGTSQEEDWDSQSER